MSIAHDQDVQTIIASRRPGFGPAGSFHGKPHVYQAELDRIWRRGWLFVGFTREIALPGDYFTFEMDSDSFIVIRDDSGS